MHPTMRMPVRLYAERDPETNEKRWYETPGMGDEYVRADEVDRLRQALRDVANNDTADMDTLATCPNDKNLQEWIALRALNSCK